jgi:hypothetical protein
MDWNKAIEFAQLVGCAYDVAPTNLVNSAGNKIVAGGRSYTVLTTIYSSELSTDLNPTGPATTVSIGLICQADGTGEVAIAIRGTEGIPEWIADFEFLQKTCPIIPGSGKTDDGFTDMYGSLRKAPALGSPTVVQSLGTLAIIPAMTSITICGHSLGGALATLLTLDVAANTSITDPTIYTYASPRTGNSDFVSTFEQLVKNRFRIANRLDVVPKVPVPPAYEHVEPHSELNPFQLVPPKFLVKMDLACEHALNTYLYLMSLQAGGPTLPLAPTCAP